MKKKSWYSEMFLNEDQHWWFVARRRIIKKVLDCYFLLDNQNKSLNILEVGCGTGGNLKLLSTYGDMYAMEPNSEAREMANSRNICKVIDASLPYNTSFEDKFDLICALDVLEYIDNDFDALEVINNMLTSNGKLLLTVPAYMFLWSYHDIAVENKRRYTKKELTRLVVNAGFNPVYSTYFNMLLFPFVVIVRTFNKILVVEKSDVNKTIKLINTFLTSILSIETLFIPRYSLPFGVSIMMLLEKSGK